MSYFGFLLRFLILPLLIIFGFVWQGRHQYRLPKSWQANPAWAGLGLLSLIAVFYTTPWDNYLVATGVWWYDPALVAGITLGVVPIEEYCFFVLQPLLTGLVLLFWVQRLSAPTEMGGRADNVPATPHWSWQHWSWQHWSWQHWSILLLMGALWIVMVVILMVGWQPGVYLALELTWALPPLLIQIAFGADILWQERYVILLTLLSSTLYLGVVDAIAIQSGTWTIDPTQSLGILVGGVLPIEELTFFLVTNILIVFGVTLMLSTVSQRRLSAMLRQRLAFMANEVK